MSFPPTEIQDLIDDADYAASQKNVITSSTGFSSQESVFFFFFFDDDDDDADGDGDGDGTQRKQKRGEVLCYD